jgi:predicted nucleotide-binding protein
MGGLSRDRTYIVSPRGIDIKIPTDLFGVTRLQYVHRGPLSLSRRLRSVKSQIRRQIAKYGPR